MTNNNRNGELPTMDEVKKVIQPLLCTVKGDSSIAELDRDYETMTGSRLPFRQLGFNSLEEMLRSMSDVVTCSYAYGQVRVRAVPKNESRHIQQLVQGQKSSTRRKGSSRGRGGFGGVRPQFAPRMPYQQQRPMLNGGQQNRQAAGGGMVYYRPPAMRDMSAPTRQPMQPASVPIRQPMQPASVPVRQPMQPVPARNPMHPVPVSDGQSGRPITKMAGSSTAKPVLNLPQTIRSHRDRLRRLVELRRLEKETYSSTKLKNRRYVGVVEVDKMKISSYPEDYATEEEAFEEAARLALAELEPKFKEADLANRLPLTKDPKLIASRAVELLRTKYPPTGCWSAAFPGQYEEVFGESLPDDWPEIVQRETNELDFNQVNDYFVIVLSKQTTTADQPESAAGGPIVEQSISEYFETSGPFVSHETAQISPRSPLRTEEPISWMKVQIFVIHREGKLGVRRTDTEDYNEWESLMTEMEMHYADPKNAHPVKGAMQSGRLYVALVDSTWLRVQLIAYSESHPNMVRVSLVDYGDIEDIDRSSVYELDPKFSVAPHQGMICRLYGLEPFDSLPAVHDHAVKLLESVYDARVISITDEPIFTVILYEPESRVDMNEWILSQVAADIPTEPLKVGRPVEQCNVSYVSSACDVFIRRPELASTQLVESLVSLLVIRQPELWPANGQLSPNGVYLGWSENKKGWMRMLILSPVPASDGNVAAQLMDYGDVELVPFDKLRSLSSISPALAQLPSQAIRVLLARVPPMNKTFKPEAAQKLREMAPQDSSLLVRCVGLETYKADQVLPVVELFERLTSLNGKMALINASLELDESLYCPIPLTDKKQPAVAESGNGSEAELRFHLESLKLRKSSTASSGLASSGLGSKSTTPSPTLMGDRVVVPEAEMPIVDTRRGPRSTYDVKVCNVSSPHHFYVQPLQTAHDLKRLTQELKDAPLKVVDPSAVIEGGFYAFLHKASGQYRRVKVVRKLGPQVQICYVDFGELDVILGGELRVLPPEFAELPAQAIKAKLSDVKPTDGDWTPQNVLFFKKYVDQRALSSTVNGFLPDRTLSLQLFDLTGQNEISVGQWLIDNCHASSAFP